MPTHHIPGTLRANANGGLTAMSKIANIVDTGTTTTEMWSSLGSVGDLLTLGPGTSIATKLHFSSPASVQTKNRLTLHTRCRTFTTSEFKEIGFFWYNFTTLTPVIEVDVQHINPSVATDQQLRLDVGPIGSLVTVIPPVSLPVTGSGVKAHASLSSAPLLISTGFKKILLLMKGGSHATEPVEIEGITFTIY